MLKEHCNSRLNRDEGNHPKTAMIRSELRVIQSAFSEKRAMRQANERFLEMDQRAFRTRSLCNTFVSSFVSSNLNDLQKRVQGFRTIDVDVTNSEDLHKLLFAGIITRMVSDNNGTSKFKTYKEGGKSSDTTVSKVSALKKAFEKTFEPGIQETYYDPRDPDQPGVKDNLKTTTTLFLGGREVEVLYTLFETVYLNYDDPDFAKKKITDLTKEYFDEQRTKALVESVELGLFGSMNATSKKHNVDGALHAGVSFAIEASNITPNFFVSGDDFKSDDDDAGAAHMGRDYISSDTMYAHDVLDLRLLRKNLNGNRTIAEEGVASFIRAYFHAQHTGGHTSYFSANLPSYVCLDFKKSPYTNQDAFTDRGASFDTIEQAIERFREVRQAKSHTYAPNDPPAFIEVSPKHPDIKATLEDAVAFVSRHVKEFYDYQDAHEGA